jgi:hypothetical protein
MAIGSTALREQGRTRGARGAARLAGACAAGCAAVLLAACSGSPSGAPAPAGGGAGRFAPVVAPPSLAQLKKIVLQPGDLPSGWKATPPRPAPKSSPGDHAFLECVGARDTSGDMVAQAYSDYFADGNEYVSSSVASYRSQGDVDSIVAMLRSPKYSTCYTQAQVNAMRASPPPHEVIEAESYNVTPGSGSGPANVVATITGTIKFEVYDEQETLYTTFVFITGPLIEGGVDVNGLGSPVPASVLSPLVAAMAARAAKG